MLNVFNMYHGIKFQVAYATVLDFQIVSNILAEMESLHINSLFQISQRYCIAFLFTENTAADAITNSV